MKPTYEGLVEEIRRDVIEGWSFNMTIERLKIKYRSPLYLKLRADPIIQEIVEISKNRNRSVGVYRKFLTP